MFTDIVNMAVIEDINRHNLHYYGWHSDDKQKSSK